MDHDCVQETIDRHGGEASSLIQVLLDLQSENRWLTREAMQLVSERLGVPLTRVQHIATFYKAFSLVPKGRHELHVCTGTACHVRGATRVLHTLEDLTGLHAGETDADLKFSLETVSCLGCCALGPVIDVDGRMHGKLSAADTAKVLKSYE